MFNSILIANRGDQLASQLAAKPNCMPTRAARAGDLDAENRYV
ncbi:hypothetical protein QKW35_18580 [Pontibacterium granulatum]|nr:hypothetical protein [Pontibacterium granulatum]MDI3326389.1 hypothetical protein [Pontibacterium granulatum]